MEARCYNGAEGRTKLNVMKARRSDYIITAVCLLVLAAVLVPEFVKVI